jgi:hypothetical protein
MGDPAFFIFSFHSTAPIAMDPSLSSLRAPWAGQCACAPLDCPQWADGCKGCECGAQAAVAAAEPMRPMLQLEQMQPARVSALPEGHGRTVWKASGG